MVGKKTSITRSSKKRVAARRATPRVKKKILYVQTSGVDTPERLYAPFILGATAAAMDLEPTIYFLVKGVTVVKRGAAEQVRVGSFPGLREVLDQALRAGVRLMVCDQSCRLMGLQSGDFIPEARIVGAATLNDLVLESDGVLYF